MKKFKVFALVFAIMLSATGLGILFGPNQPTSTQAKVSAAETTLDAGIYTVDTDGKKTKTKDWSDIVSKKTNNSLGVSLEESDGTYLVCGALPAGVTSLDDAFFNKGWLTNIIFTDSFNTSNVTNMSSMFGSCYSLTNLDLSNFNTSNVTDMSFMFSGSDVGDDGWMKLKNITFGKNFKTNKVKNMQLMFFMCSSLTNLDLSNFNTSEVEDMQWMFSGCASLTSLDLSKFDTSKITSMEIMFAGCAALISLDLSGFDTSNVTDMGNMFSGCTSLQNIKMPNTMNKSSTIKLSEIGSLGDKSWYSLASGDSKGTLVTDANVSVSTYAGNILTTNPNKSYDAINAETFTPAKPETPSTGVVLDVVLPAFSIVLVLASLVAVAFVGKKKKQY
jgi:surface protein